MKIEISNVDKNLLGEIATLITGTEAIIKVVKEEVEKPKKKETKEDIDWLPNCAPLFGNYTPDIYIGDKCNEDNSCWINYPSCFQYECHPEYKSSLYVNTNRPDKTNYFSVLDYEVYTY